MHSLQTNTLQFLHLFLLGKQYEHLTIIKIKLVNNLWQGVMGRHSFNQMFSQSLQYEFPYTTQLQIRHGFVLYQ